MRHLYVRFTVYFSLVMLLLLTFSNRSSTTSAATNTPKSSSTSSASTAAGTLALIVGPQGGTSGAGNGLYLLDTDGKNGKSVLSSKMQASFFNHVAWSPDGSRFAFINPDNPALTIADADGSDLKPTKSSSQTFAWSPDGTALTLTNGFRPFQIANFDVDSGAIKPLFPLADTLSYVDYLRWSPDGSKLLYVATPKTAKPQGDEIHIINADGSNDQVVVPVVIDRYAMWSADGTKIAYLANGITIVDLASKKVTKIAAGAVAADWSPDGSTFAYANASGQLFLTDVTGAKTRPIARPADLKGRIVAIAWRLTGTPTTSGAATAASTAPVSTSGPVATSASAAGTAAATTSGVPVAGGQTFTASDQSFSFTYPADWGAANGQKDANGVTLVTFSKPGTATKGVIFAPPNTPASAMAPITAVTQLPGVKQSQTKIGGRTALRFEGKGQAYFILYEMPIDQAGTILILVSASQATDAAALDPAIQSVLASAKAPAA